MLERNIRLILKCLATVFIFLYLTTHQISSLNCNISYPMDLVFDLPNARQFTHHWENGRWITGCLLTVFSQIISFPNTKKNPKLAIWVLNLNRSTQIKFFSGSCVCCNHDFCMDMMAKTRHKVISSDFLRFVIKTKCITTLHGGNFNQSR